MARFSRNPAKQARSVVNELRQSKVVASIRSGNNYFERLEIIARNINGWGMPRLRDLTPQDSIHYLERRSQEVGDKTLAMEKLALQHALRVSGQLGENDTLPTVKSELEQAQKSRFYTREQISLVSERQTAGNQLATRIACAAGLRAHELLTLRTISEQPPDERPALDTKWQGREGKLYTVIGKGGLVRVVLIEHELAKELEQLKLDSPEKVLDRGNVYTNHYQLPGGQKWSNSFSQASSRALGWSRGAHGLRHSYAQERMRELQRSGCTYKLALETASQEMGHFRPDITLVYLR